MKLIILTLFLLISLNMYMTRSLIKDNTYTTLYNWCISNKAQLLKMKLKQHSPSNRYYIASDNITKGEVINKIPKSLFISENTIKSKTINSYINKIKTNNNLLEFSYKTEYIYLTLILVKMFKNSKYKTNFKAYIDFLPKDVSNYPIFYNSEELKLLEGSYMSRLIKERKEVLITEYETLKKQLNIYVTLDEYLKARLLVGSRVFNVGENKIALVPIADMYNHNSESNNISWKYNEISENFEITAIKDIKKGEEIVISYGRKPNYKILLFYGFTQKDNPMKTKVDVMIRHDKQLKVETKDNDLISIEDEDFILKNIHFYRNLNKGENLESEIKSLELFLDNLELYLQDYIGHEHNKVVNYKNINSFNKENILRIIEEEKNVFSTTINGLKEVIDILKNKKERKTSNIYHNKYFNSIKDLN